jgi:ATP-dependent protease ClpP protease subunit
VKKQINKLEEPVNILAKAQTMLSIGAYSLHTDLENIYLYVGDLKNENENLGELYFCLMDLFKTNRTLHIYIDSIGGNAYELINLYNIIVNNYKNKIHTYLLNEAYSSAGLLFLLGDIKHINAYSLLMLHDVTLFPQGQIQNIKKYVEAKELIYKQLMKNVCLNFLTKKEFELLELGRDLYFGFDELKKRL